ncbi:MAG TPA: hypothetical protein DGG94_22305 [Micromonosporaceae bacterium]|nr:hypothetical protein [Micromonosporaceae bacterium]HCU52491.1 hypothetical protein [Micromonosporaceae bacterium]
MPLTESLSEVIDGRVVAIEVGKTIDRFVIRGLADADDARQQFEVMKGAVLAASLQIGGGVRVRHDLVIVDDATKPPSDPSLPIAFSEGRSLSGIMLGVGQVSFQTEKVLPAFLAALRFGFSSTQLRLALRDERVALAGVLYVDSYYETSVQAQFLSLVGVLEVLKDQAPRSAAALDMIGRWRSEVKALEDHEAQAIRGTLKDMTTISIGQGIRSVVRRHLGEESAREAKILYELRSELIHTGTTSADLNEARRRAARFANSLLMRILMAGGVG